MNFVWVTLLTISLGLLMFQNAQTAFNTVLSGSEKAVELAIKLWAIYAVWLGILKIVEEVELDKKLAKLLTPLTRRLVGNYDPYTNGQIVLNITGNLLGMGNATTPSGMNAIFGMYRGGFVATSGMIMFFILNTTNLQIIPTTIIGLRILNGSQSPNDIIFPTILASLVSTTAGILMVLLCKKIWKDKKEPQNKGQTKTGVVP